MKSIKGFLLLIILAVPAVCQTWTWVNPVPQGNVLFDIRFVDINTGYAVGESGTILKTTNSGTSWTFCSNQKYGPLGKIAIPEPNVIYVSYRYMYYMLKSTDDGLSWNPVLTNSSIQAMCFVNSSTGFVGGSGNLIQKTTDAGISWEFYGIVPVTSGNVSSFSFVDSNTGFLSYGRSVQKTTNGGLNWSIVYMETGNFDYYAVLFENSLTGYVSGAYGNIRKTTDGGNSWISLNSGTAAGLDCIVRLSSGTVLFSGRSGPFVNSVIIRTTDAGATFQSVHADQLYNLYSMWYAGANDVYSCGSKGGILRSTDAGSSWTALSSGMYNTLGKIRFIDSQTGFIAMNSDTLLRTTNAGVNWSYYLTGTNSQIQSIFSTGAGTIFAGASSSKILKSTNYGLNWVYLGNFPGSSILSMYFINSQTGYVSNDLTYLIYHTSDGGQSWDQQSIYPLQGAIEKICFVNSNTGFIGTGIGDVVKTTNGGMNWILNYHFPYGLVDGLEFPDVNTGYAIDHFLYKTTNCGGSWFISDSLSFGSGWGMSFIDANHGFVGTSPSPSTSYARIMKTSDGGISWISEYPGLPLPCNMFAVNVDTCFITGSYGAILSYKSGLVSVTNTGGEMPKQYSLYQNYPNPFNPSTKIRFQIPPSNADKGLSYVKLVIYDVLGREIVSLIHKQMQPGDYDAVWDGTNYPSGVYFYQLAVNDELIATKKMVLLK